ncbi:transmembrane GTPase fzo1 [Moesziomyces antarcticus]|uniref:Related to FZO1 - GTP-binding protein, required for biogenesis of mitochondria n=2 Tax=Pseudozyma antarctica TaxID=84753 RepID=A0A5C3FYN6_PSEA2|nr:transmembrane GTPase fzo1 [Moesziomyces antarcticus]GAK67368.1 transmembrane GTPase fzo1 [Moesziomyces antarcticus]SPO48617.1 related to FZO1 - GTP-binding protein, required for biogenesis of mitochondria [Moesziomyces antarcticus]
MSDNNNAPQMYATPAKKPVRSHTADVVAPLPTVSASLNGGDLFRTKQRQIDEARANNDAQQTFAQHQSEFEQSRDTLLGAIDNTSHLLADLRDFNKNKRIIHYATADDENAQKPGPSRPQLGQHRRTQSNALSHSPEEADAHPSSSSSSTDSTPRRAPPALMRAYTTQPAAHASLPNTPARHTTTAHHDDDQDSDESTDMSVLKLDLRVGSVAADPHALVRSLERSSVAQLLDGRMEKSERHLENLKQRLTDTQSKVLVTGDLNAGKSTFVNALLRRPLMPIDQQPCTTVFCEVLDASESNNDVEEVHMLKHGVKYSARDPSTFTRHTLDDIEQIVAEAEEMSPEDAPILKCYARDTRATQDSLLKNGIVDIALIDAPGLNRDSLKTTALFARQEEIDVVVFVVSAENHFTLSAKEFLWNASHDKAFVFIVVNKFESIKNKDKCRKLVLDQIRQLSPRTYDDAANLVHFVDSQAVFGAEVDDAEAGAAPDTPSEELGLKVQGGALSVETRSAQSLQAFARLEAALRDFVLLKRAKSKLLPSKTYMVRLLSDIAFLAKINTQVAQIELAEAIKALEVARPELARCQASQHKLESVVESEEDEAVTAVMQEAQRKLSSAIDLIGNGKPAVEAVTLPAYPGLFNVWEYAQEVRHALTSSLELALRSVEDTARGTAAQAVDRVQKLGLAHLPQDEAETRTRIFNPDAMFAKRRAMPGLVGLGLGAEVVAVQPSDFLDVYHHFVVVTGGKLTHDKRTKDGSSSSSDDEMSLVSPVSLGLGALTLMGSKALGAKTAIDAFVRVSDLVGNPTARRWAAPVLAVVSTGLVVYFIYDLPNSVPRNIGRNIKNGLASGSLVRGNGSSSTSSSGGDEQRGEEVSFGAVHSARVGRETRKVLRLASWDLQERFRVAIAQRRAEVEKQEAKQASANLAIEWFDTTTARVGEIKSTVDHVKGLEA